MAIKARWREYFQELLSMPEEGNSILETSSTSLYPDEPIVQGPSMKGVKNVIKSLNNKAPITSEIINNGEEDLYSKLHVLMNNIWEIEKMQNWICKLIPVNFEFQYIYSFSASPHEGMGSIRANLKIKIFTPSHVQTGPEVYSTCLQ